MARNSRWTAKALRSHLRAVQYLRRATDVVRPAFEVASARPAIGAGLRAAFVTVAPLVVSALMGWPPNAWVSLAGFIASLADRGGAYRTRAVSTASITFAGALAATAASLVGHDVGWAVLAMFLCGLATGLARVYGVEAGNVGSLVAVIFTASLATPAQSLQEAVTRGGSFFLGGALTTGLTLLLWPIRYYQPARRAVAACYRDLGAYAAALARWVEHPEVHDWPTLSRPVHARLRELMENARALLAATRRGRQGESSRGARLLLLLEQLEKMFTLVVAVGDQLDGLPASLPLRVPAGRVLSDLSLELAAIARVIETETGAAPLSVVWDTASLADEAAALDTFSDSDRLRRQSRQLVALFDRLGRELLDAVRPANALERNGVTETPATLEVQPRSLRSRLLDPVLANFTADSVVLRHAARVGTTTAVAVAVTHWLQLPMAHWVTLTVIVILQPYTGATLQKGVQRAGGTVVGGAIAALLAAALHDPQWILVLVFVSAAVSVSLLPLNYGLFSMLLTPTLVLLTELRFGNWHLATIRITNGLLGAALALLGSWLLWPSHERRRLPSEVAAAVTAMQAYAGAVLRFVAIGVDRPALVMAQRNAGLALINAETSFQRFLAEPVGQGQIGERYMAILVYLRRLASSLTSLAALQHHTAPDDARELMDYLERVAALLAEAATRVREGLVATEATAAQPPLTVPALHDVTLRVQMEHVNQRAADLLRLVDGRGA